MKIILVILIYFFILPIQGILFFFEPWDWLKENANSLLVLVTIIGWLVIVAVEIGRVKFELKLKVKYDAYKNLMDKAFALTNQTSELSSNFTGSHLHSMKMYTDGVLEDATKAREVWEEHLKEITDSLRSFSTSYIELIKEFELWEPFLFDLKKPKEIFGEEFQSISSNINAHLTSLIRLDISKIDYKKIEKKEDVLMTKIITFLSYQIDLKRMFCNELMGGVFDHKIEMRKTLSEESQVLTKKGLVVSLEKDKKLYEKNKMPIPKILKGNWIKKILSKLAE